MADTKGIYLALTPDRGFDQSLVGLDIHILNGLEAPITYDYDLEMDGKIAEGFKGEIPPYDLLHMGHLYFGQLNENPAITVFCSFELNGKPYTSEKTIRIKPKPIHSGPKFSPLLNEEAFVYDLYLHKEPPPAPTKLPTPKRKLDFDVEMLKHLMTEPFTPKDRIAVSPVEYELDLHFDALVKGAEGWNGAEKLNFQLDTFRQKLDSAIANGLHSMVVIHGVGSGRLKQEVTAILRQHPRVSRFGPAMSLKYGFGATEVFF